MAQNMFTYGEKQEEFTEEDAKKEEPSAPLLPPLNPLPAEDVKRLCAGHVPAEDDKKHRTGHALTKVGKNLSKWHFLYCTVLFLSVPAPHLLDMIPSFFNCLCFLHRNKFRRFYGVNLPFIRFAHPYLSFQETMFAAVSQTIVILFVDCKPVDFLFQVTIAKNGSLN